MKWSLSQIFIVCLSFVVISAAAGLSLYYLGFLINDYLYHDVIRFLARIGLILVVLVLSVFVMRKLLSRISVK